MDILQHLNVKSLELLQKLDDDQRAIAAKVIAESVRQGVNPNFTIPIAMAESKFKPDAVSKAGAIGVMQLMPDTAAGLKVDPSNVDQNIEGGIKLIKELSSNKNIGNDPIKILAGYNASTATRNKFLESGDVNVLPTETLQYIANIGGYAGGDLPSPTFEVAAEERPAVERQQPQEVIQDRTAQLGEGSPEGEAILYGGAGHSIGTGFGAAKVGTIKAAKKIYDWAHKPSAGMPNVRIDPMLEPDTPASVIRKQPPQSALTATPSTTATHGGENWVKALTGVDVPGGQMRKSDLDLAKQMQAAVGRGGAPGFVGGQITPGGVIINPQDAAALQRREELARIASERQTGVNERLQQVMQNRASQPSAPPSFGSNPAGLLKYGSPEQKDLAARAMQRVKGASNVTNLGSAGMGFGMAVPAAIAEYQKGEEGSPLTALGLGAGFGAASALFPRVAPVVGGGLSALDMANRIKNEDYTGALLSGVGTVGPLAAASLLAPPIGVPLAVGSAFVPAAINAYRDYVNYEKRKKNAGAGRGFVNPALVSPDSD